MMIFVCLFLLQVWDLNEKYCRNTMIGHENSVKHCRFSPNDEYVASCSIDGTVKVYSIFLNQPFVLMMDGGFLYQMKICIRKCCVCMISF